MLGLSEQRQVFMTQKIMHTLDQWGLSAQQQIAILELPDETRGRKLRAYHESTPLPSLPDVEYRVIRLLGIIDALRTSYPKNPMMGERWIKMPHKRFNNRTPLQVMMEDGRTGVNAILAELDCAYAWDLTGSSAK